jgi:hypothetical protein
MGEVWGKGISQNVVWYVLKTCCERAGLGGCLLGTMSADILIMSWSAASDAAKSGIYEPLGFCASPLVSFCALFSRILERLRAACRRS